VWYIAALVVLSAFFQRGINRAISITVTSILGSAVLKI
jgi:hypothetical protein